MTVFLSSHNLDEVQKICKKVAVIKAGVLRAYDTVENLRSTGDKKEVTIVTSNAAEAEKAVQILGRTASVISSQKDGAMITIEHSEGSISPILNALVIGGVGLEEIKRSSRSLEDVYLDLVKEGTA